MHVHVVKEKHAASPTQLRPSCFCSCLRTAPRQLRSFRSELPVLQLDGPRLWAHDELRRRLRALRADRKPRPTPTWAAAPGEGTASNAAGAKAKSQGKATSKAKDGAASAADGSATAGQQGGATSGPAATLAALAAAEAAEEAAPGGSVPAVLIPPGTTPKSPGKGVGSGKKGRGSAAAVSPAAPLDFSGTDPATFHPYDTRKDKEEGGASLERAATNMIVKRCGPGCVSRLACGALIRPIGYHARCRVRAMNLRVCRVTRRQTCCSTTACDDMESGFYWLPSPAVLIYSFATVLYGRFQALLAAADPAMLREYAPKEHMAGAELRAYDTAYGEFMHLYGSKLPEGAGAGGARKFVLRMRGRRDGLVIVPGGLGCAPSDTSEGFLLLLESCLSRHKCLPHAPHPLHVRGLGTALAA